MKGIADLMKQAQALQSQMQGMKEEMASAEVEGEAGAGLVRVVMNGAHEIRRVQIDPTVYEEDRSVLEDLIAAAFNDAMRRVEALQQEKMAGLAGGLGLPAGGLGGLGGFPFK